ncbi:MAG: PKD domain-containing protein, partial [Bacteroidetes bacterium]|nr:PKD domain-containing protein [Bacteroidota bacterium]
MKKSKIFSTKLFFSIVGIASMFLSARAQTPAKCFEIESILVDACNATSLEPNNEMVRFRVGPSSINISNIGIYGQAATGPYVINAWPTTTIPWLGLIQNATTAAATAALQATVVASCGHLIEPPGGIIPKGANVLMIASTNPSTIDNSFSSLTDTLYVVYHNANYSVTTGHFKNWTAVSSTRSLILVNTATGCTDTATYDVSLLTNISGGNGDRVDFSWSGVQTYLNNGCNAPFVPITSDAGSSTSACVGAPVNLTGIATGNYIGVIWQSAGSGTFSTPTSLITAYTPSVAGTYSILFGAITPCHDTVFSSLILTVTSPPLPTITASGSTTICSGSSVTLTANGGATYLWNTGAATASISVSSSGTFTVTVTNSCGSMFATQLVSVTPLPSVLINNSGTTNLCVGSTLTLWATGVGSYLWSTGSTSDSITVTTGGTYSVTASNSCGSVNSSITINNSSPPFPTITAGGSTTICVGSSLLLNGSGGTSYIWYPSGATTGSISVSAAGTYTLSASNSCGTDTATILVTTISPPTVIISPSGSTTICLGDSLTLNASGATSYLWSTGSTGNSINVISSGSYFVVASNSCGADTTSVTVITDSVNALFTGNTISGSAPLTVDFTNASSASAIIFSWSFGDGNTSNAISPSNTFQDPGVYDVTLTVTNSNGCTDIYTIQVTVENP